MTHVYYHYNNGYSRYGSRCKTFPTRRDAERWIFFVGRKYPTFQLDEIFESQSGNGWQNKGMIRI